MTQRVALVTGAVGGIGTAIVTELAKAGFKVAGNYIPFEKDKLPQWKEARQKDGVSVELFEVDVTDFEACGKFIADVQAKLGPVDVLVNNAGITRDATMKKMKKENWDMVINTNLNSVFNMTRQVVEGMLERKYGRIINISSMNGQKGQFGQANYSAAKSGIHGFTMSLAQEVARNNVTVNSVAPGYTGTPMVMAIDEKILKSIIAQIPAGRMATPEEIAWTVRFLADERSGFVNGAMIPVNGAQYTCF
ncbi:MAG: acetoacetyl-CoA reductase [Magnetococcales bacterium]|nr:acetoacetyl-CoA reductase [Magnetococcales bacterium]MBF0323162.1 acetoacetyl-CoA reductase [Magnetococcales bacterium]